jgi:hypothetical protein
MVCVRSGGDANNNATGLRNPPLPPDPLRPPHLLHRSPSILRLPPRPHTRSLLCQHLIFNLIHLRRKHKTLPSGQHTKHALSTKALHFYLAYKTVLTVVNVVSCYWSIFKYARYFAMRHPKVVEDERLLRWF